MRKNLKYTIFNTAWGYFGLVTANNALLRAQLPTKNPQLLRSRLLKSLSSPEFQKSLLKPLQQQIISYFKGQPVNFDPTIPLDLNDFTPFQKNILNNCRKVPFGQKISYTQLAKMAGSPNAARPAANTLAKNQLLLIIPCHRIIRSDGQLGGFSAPGGIKTKIKLIKHEAL